MIFEITGIRFQMKGATKDEQTTKAEQFIDSLTFPCKIRLMREMDNIYSSHAIAVYRGYKKVGYVSENNTIDLLEACECGQLSKPLIAQITGLAGHLSLTGQVEVPEHSSQKHNRARVLVSSPFHITIPFLEEDHQLHLLAHMILTENYNAENICSFIECLRDYTQMHAVSVCDCDCSYLGKILYKVKEIITENPSLPHFTLLRLKVYEKRLQELVSQVHSVGEMLQFFEDRLARLRNFYSTGIKSFYKLYDEFYFKVPLSLASEKLVRAELERLKEWLNNLPNGIFGAQDVDKEFVVAKLRYLHLSRQEMYEVMATILLVERLQQQLDIIVQQKKEAESQKGKHSIPVPEHFARIVQQVLKPQFTLSDQTVLNTQSQFLKAAKVIKQSSNVQVAMLMAIGMELGAVLPGTSCTDFIRAMVSIGALPYTDSKAIINMASGVTKKIFGFSKDGRKYPPLPAFHSRWKKADQKVGNLIFEEMTKK